MKKTALECDALEKLLELAKEFYFFKEKEAELKKSSSGDLYFSSKKAGFWTLFSKKERQDPLEHFPSVYTLFRLIQRFSEEEIKTAGKTLEIEDAVIYLEHLRDRLNVWVDQDEKQYVKIFWGEKKRYRDEDQKIAFPYHLQYSLGRFQKNRMGNEFGFLEPNLLYTIERATTLRKHILDVIHEVKKTIETSKEWKSKHFHILVKKNKLFYDLQEIKPSIRRLQEQFCEKEGSTDLERLFFLLGTMCEEQIRAECIKTIQEALKKQEQELWQLQQNHLRVEKDLFLLTAGENSHKNIEELGLLVHKALRYFEQRVCRKSFFLKNYLLGCKERIDAAQDLYQKMHKKMDLYQRVLKENEMRSIDYAKESIITCIAPPKEVLSIASLVDRLLQRSKGFVPSNNKLRIERLRSILYKIGKEGFFAYHVEMLKHMEKEITEGFSSGF